MAKIRAVAIERQYCSGGREIARLAAEKLGFACYDKELAMLTAEKMGVEPELIAKYEETLQSPFLSPVSFKTGIDRKKNMSEVIFEIQAEIITSLAKQAPCIIVGRCADYILRNNVPTLSVFVYANPESRLQHAMECHDIPYDKASSTMRKMDRKRSEYYKLNTRKDWDSMFGYDLCINSGKLGLDNAALLIADYVQHSV
ncbi:MAG: cytidylate kinase-like family protein [Ruminococcus sp.]|nr:cytidylate kinase-like family protein [Ruminococcus sp.]